MPSLHVHAKAPAAVLCTAELGALDGFQYEFTAFARFCDHLQATLHADTDASTVECDQYLADMYKHLHNAQDMYVRVNKPVTHAAAPAKASGLCFVKQPVKKQQTPKKSNNTSSSTDKRGRGMLVGRPFAIHAALQPWCQGEVNPCWAVQGP